MARDSARNLARISRRKCVSVAPQPTPDLVIKCVLVANERGRDSSMLQCVLNGIADAVLTRAWISATHRRHVIRRLGSRRMRFRIDRFSHKEIQRESEAISVKSSSQPVGAF
ncbi:hypothetical protein KXD40_005606 [Peronospora effusa]|uniref:Uncharacterized protein n=1 Tax=Peronospora effusa TaxID=542832 RepID=A0A3M6VD12_9STRA|nr:hypothetical protein DD238_005937 [Peronospora effusa]RQM12951.1 hypothetical protein DD237_006512 [Peronospora effusa]UIZ27326.1 hypothetical protein KXD40_005606 [Peronospora effusa]CAI5727468.1 unnamed protein product [Peronospora effusa]